METPVEASEPSPCSEDSEEFECILPITVIELSDDDFLEREDEEHMDLNEDGCLIAQAKEDRKIDNEVKEPSSSDGLQRSNGEEQDIPFEIITVKNSDEEMPVSCENLASVQMDFLRNALDNFFCGQEWAVGFFDNQTCNVTENERVNVNNSEIDHNYCQKMLASDLDTHNQGKDEQTIGGAVHLDNGVNENDNRPRKCGKLQDDLLLGRRCEEYQNIVDKNNAHVSPVKEDCSLEDFSGDAEDGSNLVLGAACHYVQPAVADGLAENDVQEDLNKSIQFGQQLQMELSEKTLLLSNKPKNNIPLMKYAKRRGARKCLFCNLSYKSSIHLRKHIYVAHKDKRRYSCDLCCRNFFFSGSLQCHQQLHTKMTLKKRKEARHDTQGNGKPKDRIALKKRKKKEKKTIEDLFKCHQCVYTSDSISKLQAHFSVHTDEKLFRCNECDKSFHNPSRLKRHNLSHMRKHHKFNIGSTVEEPKVCQESPDSEDLLHTKMSLKKRKEARHDTQGNGKPKDRIALKKRKKKGKKTIQDLFKCHQCVYTSDSISKLQAHFSVHTDEKLFRCKECDKSFHNPSRLKRHNLSHMRKHHKFNIGSTVEESKVCQESSDSEDLLRHILPSTSKYKNKKKQVNLTEKNEIRPTSEGLHSQICKYEYCDYATQRLAHLKGHRRMNTDKKLYSCDVCDKQFCTSGHLKCHKLLHQNVDLQGKSHSHAQKRECPSSLGHETSRPVSKPYICDDCGLVFRKKRDLQHHEVVHLQTQPYEHVTDKELECGSTLSAVQPSRGSVVKLLKCHQCDYTTKSVGNLQVHFTVHTGEKAFRCQECDKSFRSSSHLKRHSTLHLWKPYRCHRCLFMSSTVEELNMHQENCNSEDTIKKELRPSALRCDNTKKQVDMAEGNKDPLKLQELDSEPYRCEQCDYVTYKLAHLKRHKFRYHHPEPLKCGSCDFSTDNGQCLKKHMASHTNTRSSHRRCLEKESSLFVKVYKCEECHYVTDRNENLKIHLRIHKDERPYKCSHCSLAFRTSSHLKRHLATHLKLQCTKCNFLAINKQALKKHNKTHKKKESSVFGKEKDP